jgi:hypothetical protein
MKARRIDKIVDPDNIGFSFAYPKYNHANHNEREL